MNTTTIKPKKTLSWTDLKELWTYKELLYFFTWKDFKVRYKQTAVGISWAVFQPFMTMIVFSVFAWLRPPSSAIRCEPKLL